MDIAAILISKNLDLFAVGITVAAIGILGFAVFLSNRRSITNKTFLVFAFLAIIWGISNYLNYQFSDPKVVLWVLRFHLFISTLYAFTLFHLLYVFPNENAKFSKRYKLILVPLVIFVAILTLTPLVFSRIVELAPVGKVTNPERGPGIILFAAMASYLVFGGLFQLLKRLRRSSGIEKVQFRYVLIGMIITFSLHIIFNTVLPVFFNQLGFIPLGSLFAFPLAVFTGYAIMRHHLLNVKVIATEILTFVLAVVTLFEVILARDLATIVLRSGVFVLVLAFGILLIRSVRKEVEQREELARLNLKLEKANTELESLSRFKTQLLSLASHQVKSPLAAIKGFATLLIEGSYGAISEKVKETVEKMKKASDNLINLVNTLLDLRKVEEGKMEYQFSKTGLRDMVNGVVDNLRPLAQEKKLELTFTGPKTEVFVNADGPKLQQVIQNLIDNAIKYTPAGFVRVKMEETSDKGNVIVSVTDSGVGIPKELLPHLFEEFIRDERIKKDILGTGLGLYIARKMIEAHHGTIGAESEGPGRGSKFFVKLKKV